MPEAGPSTGYGCGRNFPPQYDQKPLAASHQISIDMTLEDAIAGAGESVDSPIVLLGAEIVHEGRMDGGLALFACVANTLGNRTETSHEAGQEIAVEKFLYGTHGSSLILFFVSRQHIFCPGCRNNGQFSMTVMRQCIAGAGAGLKDDHIDVRTGRRGRPAAINPRRYSPWVVDCPLGVKPCPPKEKLR